MSVLYPINDLVAMGVAQRASDIHIVCGIPIRMRIDGKLVSCDVKVVKPMREIYQIFTDRFLLDPEECLTASSEKFILRFEKAESSAKEKGFSVAELDEKEAFSLLQGANKNV